MNVVEELTELYESRRDDYVRMYLSRAGGNDAEDLVQEGFYRALRYADSYKPNLVKLETWFSGILENCLKDLYVEKRNGSSMHGTLTEDCAIYDMPTESDGLIQLLEREILKKSQRTKDALYFYFFLGYKPSVIDSIVGLTSTRELVNQFKQYLRLTYPEYMED